MKDERDEMPSDFDNEIHKWSLECMYIKLKKVCVNISKCVYFRYWPRILRRQIRMSGSKYNFRFGASKNYRRCKICVT